MKTDLTVHMIVLNEEQWVWYAIQSVISYVEQLFIFDTGSTDNTVNIIKQIKSRKIVFNQKERVTPDQLVGLRNEQLHKTNTSWFMLLDGDEVWPEETMAKFTSMTRNATDSASGIVVPAVVPVGDLFHFQPESAGKYNLLGQTGHMNLRGYRKLNGYKWQGIYPREAYADKRSLPIQENMANLVMLKNQYWHLTHLHRSSIDMHKKQKLEIGEKRSNTYLPEVFFATRPKIVPSPWIHFSTIEKVAASLITPALRLKRKLQ